MQRMQELLPLKNMWAWLEKEFPERKFNSCKIIFSPLIGGSHSTQNYRKLLNPETKEMYSESIMFVCGTMRYDKQKQLSEKQKQGLMSGVVFTEIDHNYINPTTAKYQKQIAAIFDKENFWAPKDRNNYNNAIAVFNEYMTHAVFCLWVEDNFDRATANYIIKEREALNAEKREFNQELSKLRKNNPNLTVAELYPLIIKWSANLIH